MKSLYLKNEMAYDGSQLRSLYAYLDHGVLGSSIISWSGACDIPFTHMVDGEDLLEKALIKSDKMLHFIIEVFDRDLFSAVSLQRLFASIAKDYLQDKAHTILATQPLRRDGDDIYWGDRKISISIASKSPVSVMVHFAMNITNEGTPVKTASLNDLKLNVEEVAQDLMAAFVREFDSILIATQKVRPLT